MVFLSLLIVLVIWLLYGVIWSREVNEDMLYSHKDIMVSFIVDIWSVVPLPLRMPAAIRLLLLVLFQSGWWQLFPSRLAYVLLIILALWWHTADLLTFSLHISDFPPRFGRSSFFFNDWFYVLYIKSILRSFRAIHVHSFFLPSFN